MTQLRRLDGAAWAFLALAAASVPLVLWAARDRWFWLDEWEVILERDLSDPGSLFRPWWGHCIALPTAVFRVLVDTVGLRSYRPYLLVGLAAHLASTSVVLVTTRRLGVRGWLATAAVAPLLVLGSGRENIVFAFQVTLTAALALGLVQLLLASGRGPWSRRDSLGLLCGAVGLLCSGVVLPTAAGAGTAALLRRRGWRVAAAHTVPLALGFLLWSSLATSVQDRPSQLGGAAVRAAWDIAVAPWTGMAQHGAVAVLLVGVFAVGSVPSVRRLPLAPARRSDALVAGLLVAAAAFAGLTAIKKIEPGVNSRYVHVLASLLLPIVALGVERLARRDLRVGLVALAALLVGVPGNVAVLDGTSTEERTFAAMFRSPRLESAPDDQRVLWLDAALARALIAEGDAVTPLRLEATPTEELTADLFLLLSPRVVDEPTGCATVGMATVDLGPGDPVLVRGDVDVVLLDGPRRSRPLRLREHPGARQLRAHEPVRVEVRGVGGGSVLSC